MRRRGRRKLKGNRRFELRTGQDIRTDSVPAQPRLASYLDSALSHGREVVMPCNVALLSPTRGRPVQRCVKRFRLNSPNAKYVFLLQSDASFTDNSENTMEALNAGASVLTFAACAGSGLQELYKAVAAFKDGPLDVENLLDAIEELTGLIAQLSEIFNDQCTTPDPRFASRLRKSLTSCQKTTNGFKTRLETCRAAASNGAMQWMMARLRQVLCQSDFEKMRLAMLRHLAVFSVHVGVANG